MENQNRDADVSVGEYMYVDDLDCPLYFSRKRCPWSSTPFAIIVEMWTNLPLSGGPWDSSCSWEGRIASDIPLRRIPEDRKKNTFEISSCC